MLVDLRVWLLAHEFFGTNHHSAAHARVRNVCDAVLGEKSLLELYHLVFVLVEGCCLWLRCLLVCRRVHGITGNSALQLLQIKWSHID